MRETQVIIREKSVHKNSPTVFGLIDGPFSAIAVSLVRGGRGPKEIIVDRSIVRIGFSTTESVSMLMQMPLLQLADHHQAAAATCVWHESENRLTTSWLAWLGSSISSLLGHNLPLFCAPPILKCY